MGRATDVIRERNSAILWYPYTDSGMGDAEVKSEHQIRQINVIHNYFPQLQKPAFSARVLRLARTSALIAVAVYQTLMLCTYLTWGWVPEIKAHINQMTRLPSRRVNHDGQIAQDKLLVIFSTFEIGALSTCIE
ncbi:hypothetical protein CJ030_MR3G018329 [Morella rubra]|uniref:Uncharacterized protein n=1 Tax=Morella rubra TaxID=262757 RepID=A0A6A1W459_9ROSI|nr:hypothetical protein CJ030_MR3G018329 [Morella rubra]